MRFHIGDAPNDSCACYSTSLCAPVPASLLPCLHGPILPVLLYLTLSLFLTSTQSPGLSCILSRAHLLTLAFSLSRALWLAAELAGAQAIGVTTGIFTRDHLSSAATSCVVFDDLRDTEEVLAALGVSP